MTAYKQAYGEHCTHEVVPFAENVLARVPRRTHRGLAGGNRWHKGDAVFTQGVWVGRTETSDEHVVLTPGGRVLSRTSRRLQQSRPHDAVFLSIVKGLPWDAEDGILRGRPRKESAPPPPIPVGENTQKHSPSPDLPDNTAYSDSVSPKETKDTNDTDNVPVSQTPMNDCRDASHIKSKSSLDDTSGVRQRLKFDGVATGMAPDPKRSKETVKQGEIRESTLFLVSRLTGRRSDSCKNLEMAARVQSWWKSWSRTTGLTNMAKVQCMRDYIAMWNKIWIRRPQVRDHRPLSDSERSGHLRWYLGSYSTGTLA